MILKILGRFNYPLLIKIIQLIFISLALNALFHSGKIKSAMKKIKIDDYFKIVFKYVNLNK